MFRLQYNFRIKVRFSQDFRTPGIIHSLTPTLINEKEQYMPNPMQMESNFQWILLIPPKDKTNQEMWYLNLLIWNSSLILAVYAKIIITMFRSKRQVKNAKRAGYYPCGVCRRNCTSNSVKCDNCEVWYHYGCEQIHDIDIHFVENTLDRFMCLHCLSGLEYMYTDALQRLSKVSLV